MDDAARLARDLRAVAAVFQGSAAAVAARLEAEYRAALAQELREIDEAFRNKTRLPDHHWQTRHYAEQRWRAAVRLMESLDG